MFLRLLTVYLGMVAISAFVFYLLRGWRRRRVLSSAVAGGLVIDESGNVNVKSTYAAMARLEIAPNDTCADKKGRFMELMRICSEGPQTIDDICLLLEEGIEPVVRPDGLVYVPCLENEHLYMEGEIEFTEEDLDSFLKQEANRFGGTAGPSDRADGE